MPGTLPANGLTLSVREPVDMPTLRVTVFALIPILLIVAASALLYERLNRAQAGKRRNFVEGFLIDSETQQLYSLSRAQFYWWLLVISFAYSFLFIGHGRRPGNWSFPTA